MKNYKKTKRLLVITVVFLTALCIALLVTVVFKSITKESNVCKSKECTVAAASLISSMDESKDPCNDFYSYVCAQYVHTTPELSDHFVERKKLLKLQVRELMERPNSPTDPEAVQKARLAYKECLNTTRIIELGMTPLRKFVQALGGWPIAEGPNWLVHPDSFIEDLLAKLEGIGYSGDLFKLSIAPDPINPDIKRITLDQPNDEDNFDVSRKKREDNDKENDTKMELIEVTARVLGENNNTHKIKADVLEIISLTEDLKTILSPEIIRRNQTRLYNKMSIKQFHNVTNHTFNWFSFLQNVFGKENVPDENVIINVVEVEYMKKMPVILATYGRRIVTNFVMWNVISDTLAYVTDKAYNQESLKSTLRWQVCLQDISESMSFAMWRIYADNMLSSETMKYAEELVSNLYDAYRETIENSRWLDFKTKENALKKLNGMMQLVGYPEWIDKEDELNAYYKHYTVTPNHFVNMVTAMSLSTQRLIRDMRKPIDRKEWPEGIGVLTANAFYVLASNTIYLPGGILQPPFYSPNRPQAMNYGSIGSIIGHEIGHAFDDEGSQMDERGALHEWWTKLSRETYIYRSLCFKNQYNGYCFNETEARNNKTCVDGGLTLGENVPDNTGLQCAFKAYNRWVKKNTEEKRLVGLDEFNAQQLFFISYAYTWCENITPKQWFFYFGIDPHSPGRYRVQGPLSNFHDFAQTFQCKSGSMNRGESSCTLW